MRSGISVPALKHCAATAMAAALFAATAVAQPRLTTGMPTTSPAPGNGPPPASAPTPDEGVTKAGERDKERARQLFKQGLALARQQAWQPALAAFMRSRELFPTRGNTQNAGIALSRVGRYDEAYETFSALLREFPELAPGDREQVRQELNKLAKLVGTIEIVSIDAGATVAIDGRARGRIPLAAPLRVAAGTHLIRVFLEGRLPWVRRVDIAGGQALRLTVDLPRLASAGTLKVVEPSGAPANVVVDGAVVGKAPWQGRLAPGSHWVSLRGAANLGTPPARAIVTEDRSTTLSLALSRLECRIRLAPLPVTAELSIDGVEVGRGVWRGRLKCGNHRVEAAEAGFITRREMLALKRDAPLSMSLELTRDPTAERWRVVTPPRFGLGLFAGPVFSPSLAGDAAADCSGGCSHPLPLGARLALTARYQLSSGLGFGVELGANRLRERVKRRSTSIRDLSNNSAAAAITTDAALLSGIDAALVASLHRGDPWHWRAALSAGVLLGSVEATRQGELGSGERLDDFARDSSARYLRFASEFGLGRRVSENVLIGLRLNVALLIALQEPTLEQGEELLRAHNSSGPSRLVRYEDEALMGRTILLVTPMLGLDYEFF